MSYLPTMNSTPIVTPQDARKLGAEKGSAWRTCRTEGHQLDPLDAYKVVDRSNPTLHGALYKSKRCARCGAEKQWWVSLRTGSVIQTKWVYPEGYCIQGMGRLDGEGRNAIRKIEAQQFVRQLSTPKFRVA